MRETMILACVVTLLAGCGSTPMTPADGGIPVVVEVAQVAGGAPDFSCLGTLTAPVAGAPIEMTAAFTEAVSRATLPAGARVEFFPGNRILDTCVEPDCFTTTASATGQVMVTLPASSWYAFRVNEGGAATTEPVETVGYNRPTPAAAGVAPEGFISRATIGLIPMLYSRMRVPGTAIVSGAVYDCNGHAVGNAKVNVFRGENEIIQGTGASDPFVGYFMGSSPCPTRCRDTDMGTAADPTLGARFAFANILASDEPVRVEIRATLAEGEEPTLISCEEIDAIADAVAIISMRPVRSDYPAGSTCIGRN
jgi:hypothetical protein